MPKAIDLNYTTPTEYAGEAEGGRMHAYCLAGIASAVAATRRDTEAAALWGVRQPQRDRAGRGEAGAYEKR